MLAARVSECGFPCACSPKMGRFKGPGRRTDPCPYATLLMLAALLQTDDKTRPELRTGAECLLRLWERSHDEHPFLFYMGTDFRKLKAPFIWYDILHVADVLSQLPWLQGDSRMEDILSTIRYPKRTKTAGIRQNQSGWHGKHGILGRRSCPRPGSRSWCSGYSSEPVDSNE